MSAEKKYSDEILLELLAGGGMDAFETVFGKYYPALCVYACRYVDADVAENIVQDVMMWLWENRRSLSGSMNLQGYLYRAVKNRCLSHINHIAIRNRVLGNMQDNMADKFDNPDTYAIEELKDNIDSALEDMPKTYRQAFEMNRFDKKTYNEIAEELSLSPKTVAYRIQQGIVYLKKKLKDYL